MPVAVPPPEGSAAAKVPDREALRMDHPNLPALPHRGPGLVAAAVGHRPKCPTTTLWAHRG